MATGPEIEQRTREQASTLARSDVRQVAASWEGGVRRARDQGLGPPATVSAGHRAALSAPVAYLTLLDDGTQPSSVQLRVAVVHAVTGGSALVTTTETVRVCAQLTLALTAGSVAEISNADCPSTLPPFVPGLGTVTATVPYAA